VRDARLLPLYGVTVIPEPSGFFWPRLSETPNVQTWPWDPALPCADIAPWLQREDEQALRVGEELSRESPFSLDVANDHAMHTGPAFTFERFV